jgi:hypothetical protein
MRCAAQLKIGSGGAVEFTIDGHDIHMGSTSHGLDVAWARQSQSRLRSQRDFYQKIAQFSDSLRRDARCSSKRVGRRAKRQRGLR